MKETVILTGATGAIGTELARGILQRGYPLVLGCRNAQKAESLKAQLEKEFPGASISAVTLDLEREDSVRRFAESLPDTPLILLNNAGVMRRTYAADPLGRELTIVVNYIHTRLLTDLLLATGRLKRVVFTTSLTRFMYRPFSCGETVTEKDFHQLRTYGQSKRLITDYAARLHAEGRVEVTCGDPGIVDTGMINMKRWYDPLADIFFRPFIRSPHHGAEPSLRALTSPPGYIYCRHRRHPLPAYR